MSRNFQAGKASAAAAFAGGTYVPVHAARRMTWVEHMPAASGKALAEEYFCRSVTSTIRIGVKVACLFPSQPVFASLGNRLRHDHKVRTDGCVGGTDQDRRRCMVAQANGGPLMPMEDETSGKTQDTAAAAAQEDDPWAGLSPEEREARMRRFCWDVGDVQLVYRPGDDEAK
jgi:hypothetical protein